MVYDVPPTGSVARAPNEFFDVMGVCLSGRSRGPCERDRRSRWRDPRVGRQAAGEYRPRVRALFPTQANATGRQTVLSVERPCALLPSTYLVTLPSVRSTRRSVRAALLSISMVTAALAAPRVATAQGALPTDSAALRKTAVAAVHAFEAGAFH